MTTQTVRNGTSRREALAKARQSRRPSRLGTPAGVAVKPDWVLDSDAGIPGLLTRVWQEAAAAPSLDEANSLYQQAEALLEKDFPTAPLWYNKATAAWSDRVTDVKVNAFGVLDFSAIKVK